MSLIRLVARLILVVVGGIAGCFAESKHYRQLRRREAAPGPTLTNLKRLPRGLVAARTFMCVGSVVIASDYAKSFAGAFESLIGGEVTQLETLIDRGQRESLQRLRDQAAAHGAAIVLNIRLETAVIGQGAEIIAYGTGVKLAN